MKMKPQALTQAADLHKHPQARNDMMKMRPQVLTQAAGSRKLPQTRKSKDAKTWNCRQTQIAGYQNVELSSNSAWRDAKTWNRRHSGKLPQIGMSE